MAGAGDCDGRAQRPGSDATPDADGGLGIEKPRELRDVRRFSHEAMATVFEVYAVHPDERYAAQAAQAAFDLVDRLERELSRFLPNSDIARINHLAAGESTRVSPSTLECLVIARHVFDLTGGAFDVSIGTGLPSLELDADDFVVRATTGGVRVDLGGIGKGYAVDLMAELLEEWGLERGARPRRLQLRPRARAAGRPRRLAADAERSRCSLPGAGPPLGAPDGARGLRVAQGRPHRGPAHRRARARAARGLGRGAPARAARAEASAEEAPRVAAAAVTDALTTAFMLLSLEEIEALCERSPGLEAWILPDAGRPHGETRLLHFGGRRLESSLAHGLEPREAVASLPDGYTSDRTAVRPRASTRQTQGAGQQETSNGWRGREGQGAGAGRSRRAEEAGSARRAEGAVHGPRARPVRLRVAEAAPVPAGEGGGGRRAARGRRRPAGDQRRPPRRGRAGPGADRRDAPHPRACASARCATSGRSTTRSASSTA